ncbi:hypothetical protein GCM10020001_098730 [Nonomuraea salmonea]
MQADELQQLPRADREVRPAGRRVVGNRPLLDRDDLAAAAVDVADRRPVQDRLIGVEGGTPQPQRRHQTFAEHVVKGLAA